MIITQAVLDKKCCSCGICVGLCPKQAIDLVLEQGIPIPHIRMESCVECGICYELCPGVAGIEDIAKCEETQLKEYIIGSFLDSYNAHTKDDDILKLSTSGGIVTTLIKSLVGLNYDAAFAVKANKYDDIVGTAYCNGIEDFGKTGKSRYVPISQDEAIRYMLKHRRARLILVGTSCAIRGIDAVIKKFHLPREQYLLIGLFCEKTMTYKVWDYFSKFGKEDEQLIAMNFRDKDVNGWPGGVKLVFANGQKLLDKKRRSEVKDFFCHPHCLYCIDKLNKYADISVGDNYTKEHTNKKGSSSIIVRTERGKKAWDCISNELNIYSVDIDKIYQSQECSKKRENYIFAKMRFGQKPHPDIKTRLKYHYKRWKIKVGTSKLHNRQILKWSIALDKKLKF